MDNFNFAQQGWQCPICKRVYSPFTPCCFTCGAGVKISKPTTGTPKASLDCWGNDPILLTSNPPKLRWKCRYCGKEITTEVTEIPTTICNCLAEDKRTCDYCKHNAGLPSHNGTVEYSGACKNCVAKDMWESNND